MEIFLFDNQYPLYKEWDHIRSVVFKTFSYAKFSIRNRGIKYFVREACKLVADRALRKYLHPTLDDFSISKFSGKFDGREVIHKLLEYIPDASIMNSMDEF